MTETFPELVVWYNGASQIPNDVLYDYLKSPEVWGSLQNLAKLGSDEITKSAIGEEVRRRAKSDLFFLARYFTWETNPYGTGKPITDNKITEDEYRVLCDLFVKKDCTKSVLKQDTEFKTRMVLWPRGGMKSTIDVCDVAQWVLNFPDIRILFLTATDGLAIGFLDELKGHFVIKLGEPSLMNLFFPEYCVEEKYLGNQFEFTCPLWAAKGAIRKEPTVMASSLASNKSGLHFEVIKADDGVSDKNSESPEQCATVSKKLFLAKKLLNPGGYYLDYIGTRYDDSDHYGTLLEKNIGDLITEYGRGWILTINTTTGSKLLVARAITIKQDVAIQLAKDGKPVTYKEAGEEGCDLLIPTVMPYAWLMREYAENEETFEAQLNQNPTPASSIMFDRTLLLRNTIPFNEMPFRGMVSQTWDFAFSKKKGRDYTTASSVMWNEKGQMFVTDLIRSRFNNPTALAQAIVDFAVKHHPFVIGIEKAAGSELLAPTIEAKARETNDPRVIAVCSKIDWITVDNQKDAKKMRMATLHPWLSDGRLKFVNFLPHLETLYSEFEKCLTNHHHDDIPDVLSRQPKYAPAMQMMSEKTDQNFLSPDQAEWNLIFCEEVDPFGRVGFGAPPPIVQMEPEPEVRAETPNGLPCILGAGIYG